MKKSSSAIGESLSWIFPANDLPNYRVSDAVRNAVIHRVIILLAAVCFGGPLMRAKEEILNTESLVSFFPGLYKRTPLDCPERMAVNRIRDKYWHREDFKILRGEIKASDQEFQNAMQELTKLRELIRQGQTWPIRQREKCCIPYAASPPLVNGDDDGQAWDNALVFSGEYPLGSLDKVHSEIVFRLLWDEQFLYVSVTVHDLDINSISADENSKLGPWDADCVEIFIMPSMRMKSYWEIVVNPNNEVYDGLHSSNKLGGFSSHPEEDLEGLRHTVKRTGSGYVVQVAIPFNELPNYMLGNKPEKGQILYFTVLRVDNGNRSALRPLLYDGHNIFGYQEATLN